MVKRIQFLGKYPIHCSIVKINGDGTEFLTEEEKRIYGSFTLRKRRREWLAGRIAGKESVMHYLDLRGTRVASNRIGILSRPSRAPYVMIDNEEAANLNISISHSNEIAVAAASGDGIIGLGVDIEIVEDRSSSFSRVAFTSGERESFAGFTGKDFSLLSTMAYTLKEAVTKALGIGLSVNTHDVEIFYADSKFLVKKNGAETGPAMEAFSKIGPPGSCFAPLHQDATEPSETKMFPTGPRFCEHRQAKNIDFLSSFSPLTIYIWNACLHNEASARLKQLGGGRLLLRTSLLSDLLLSEADTLQTENTYAVGFACAIE